MYYFFPIHIFAPSEYGLGKKSIYPYPIQPNPNYLKIRRVLQFRLTTQSGFTYFGFHIHHLDSWHSDMELLCLKCTIPEPNADFLWQSEEAMRH